MLCAVQGDGRARGSDARMMSFWVLTCCAVHGVGRGRCDVAHEVVHAESGIHVARWRDCLRELLRLVDSCRFVIPVHTWRGRSRGCVYKTKVECGVAR